jgi:hypothetical protein
MHFSSLFGSPNGTCEDALKKDKNYVQLSTLLLELFYFYKNSAKQKRNLKECVKVVKVFFIIQNSEVGDV